MARFVNIFASCLFFALITWDFVEGSRISLTASRPSIQPLLTSSLKLRCALEETSSSSSVIGRSITSTSDSSSNNNNNGGIVQSAVNHTRRNVPSTPYNVKFVNSMFLFLNKADIASLSEHVPARAVGNAQNLNVSGAIPGEQGEQGVLEVELSYPEASQGGNYSCQITAIDDIGHSVTYSASIDIDVTTPTVNDTVHFIHKLQLENDRNKAEITSNKAEITSNKAEIAALKEELDISRHIESGIVRFADLGDVWGHGQSATHSVTFSKPYSAAPMVHVAVMDFGTYKDLNAYFHVKLVTVDTHGFTVTHSLDHSDHFLEHLDLSWLSVPRV